MTDKFSATLRLGDLNDFIAPSQSCIVSLKGLKANPKAEDVLVQMQDKVQPKSDPSRIEPVKVTLHDCLACSGCLTSAETVMLEQQSVNEFLSRITSGEKAIIVSLSPQSRASLAAYYGWICYAEKTLGSYILPYISTVKSPQQAMGAIIKQHVCKKMDLLPENVYHVTIMPCYDKKLEAARDDFVFSVERQGETGQEAAGPRLSEVDCVLTSGEMLDLLKVASVTIIESLTSENKLQMVQLRVDAKILLEAKF